MLIIVSSWWTLTSRTWWFCWIRLRLCTSKHFYLRHDQERNFPLESNQQQEELSTLVSSSRVGGDGILERMQVMKSCLYRVRTKRWVAYDEDWSTWGGLPVTKSWETWLSLVLFATRILDDTALYPRRRSQNSIGDKPPCYLFFFFSLIHWWWR